MKTILFISLLFVVTSCSSPVKTPDVLTSAPVDAVPAQAESAVDTAADTSAATSATDSASDADTGSAMMPDIEGDSVRDLNCAMGQDNRTVSIIKRTDAAGWGVVYTKFGTKKTIAIARNDRSFCDEILERVKGKLESAGFQCDGESSSADASAMTGASADSNEAAVEKKESLLDKAKSMKDAAGGKAGSLLDKAKSMKDAATDGGASALEKAKDAVNAVQGE